MQYNYQTQQLLDKGVNFATIYPEKQGVVKEMTGFDFDLVNIVSFLKKETDNFTILLPLALEIDKNIVSIYNKYQVSQGKKAEEPKAEPIPEPPKKEEPKDERPSVAILTGRLKLIKKMYAKTPTVVLKGRIKIIEKMLKQPEKFCCGGSPNYAISDSVKMAGGGKTGSSFPYQGEGFTIVQMREFLRNKFVDSFGFKVFPIKKETTCTADYDAEIVKGRTSEGLNDKDIGSKLYFPQYKRDHQINYEIQQGGENTYYDFLLDDEKGNGYAGTFGFKDRGDVGPEHITGFLVFLQEQYGLPFQTEHNVYSGGGYVGKTSEQVWKEWNSGQRLHFLIDHNNREQYTPMSIEDLSKKAYNFIPEYYKKELEKHVTMGQYSTGGELKSELKRLNDELALTERGTPERMEVIGKINMLKHLNPELRRFSSGGGMNEGILVSQELGKSIKIRTDATSTQVIPNAAMKSYTHNTTPIEFKKGGKVEITYVVQKNVRGKASHYSLDEYHNGILKDAVAYDTKKEAEDAKKEKTSGKIYNYKGVEVSIRPASKGSKKYIVWDIKTDQQFSNEKFGSKKEAEDFVKENKMVLKK